MGMFLRRGPAPHRTRLSDLEIGQTIKLNLNGTPWDWLVVHQGLPSSIYDDSCNGTWLLMKNIYETRAWSSSNSNVYATNTINTYLGGDFLAKFDSNVQNAIKQVKIPYCVGGGNSTVNSGANGLPCKVFLLSGYEVGWTTSVDTSFPVDGAKLDYFESGTGTSANNKRIAYLNGTAKDWWSRSPFVYNGYQTIFIAQEGYWAYTYTAYPSGIRPALVLPSDFIVSEEMLAA
nr:MAG TPA: hypothetical protein [Caudoviricetes sp.]